jgi:hypothetical protein
MCKCRLQDMRRARVIGAGDARLRLRWCSVDLAARTLLDHTPSLATQLDNVVTSLHTTVWGQSPWADLHLVRRDSGSCMR